MVIRQTKTLVSRNARDKVQVAIVTLKQEDSIFYILRETGQHYGKFTLQPTLVIAKGKAKRTALEQALLDFNSIINKYLDKGYKDLSTLTKKDYVDLKTSELDSLVPTLKSDQAGNLKPMLAKQSEKCQNSIFNKTLYCSRKLNGVRMMVKYVDGQLVTVSRGGKDYDVSSKLILQELVPFFIKYPDLILDGEVYKHGMHLQTISGLARLKTWQPRCKVLEYWIYDIASDKMTFEERNKILLELLTLFENAKRIKVLEHYIAKSWLQVQKYHDQWVSEGFEGAVARKHDKVYEFGKRTSSMIKIKMYKDAEFLIIDYAEKLRDEDFCFICQTKEGKQFEAKPIGDRDLKNWYLENMDDIIGRYGKVKYFEISKEGIPLQPVFQAVRYEED